MTHDRQNQESVAAELDLPRWARELKERIDARMTSLFVLHYNVGDEVRFGDQFVSLPNFLGRWLAVDERMIVYDRSRGLHFSDSATEALFRKVTGLTNEAEAAKRRALTAWVKRFRRNARCRLTRPRSLRSSRQRSGPAASAPGRDPRSWC